MKKLIALSLVIGGVVSAVIEAQRRKFKACFFDACVWPDGDVLPEENEQWE